MGDGKKLAKARREMSDMQREAVAELLASRNRQDELVGKCREAVRRGNFLALLCVLILVCWAVTRVWG